MSALLLILLLALPAGATADHVVGIRWSDPEQLLELEGDGVRLRYIAPGVAFISDIGDGQALRRTGVRVLLEDRAEGDEAYYLTDHLHSPAGEEVVYVGRRGWALLRLGGRRALASLGEAQFLYPLPESYSVAGLLTPPTRKLAATQDSVAVTDLVTLIEASHVRGHIRSLALLDTGGVSELANLRTRYCLRPETSDATQYIRQQLAEHLGDHAVEVREFALEIGDIIARVPDLTLGDDLTMYNVVGELPGTDPEAGHYIICAHYDATGSRTPGSWDWRLDPAPGANDNATGVAVVLEAARVLSQLSFPWSIRFALWSGEELGLWGSRDYAAQALEDDDRILGVINVDMVGYNNRHQRVELVTNPASQWLVDLLRDANERYGIGLQVDVLDDPFAGLSDHAPFWARGYDALLAIENYLPNDTLSTGIIDGVYVPYRAYHSTADVPDSVNWELVARIARLSVASLAQFSEGAGPPNLAVHTGDLIGDPEDNLRITIANTGRGPLDQAAQVVVSRCADDSTDCQVIHHDEVLPGLPPGEAAEVSVDWQRYGEMVFLVEVDPEDDIAEVSEADNRAFQSVRLVPHHDIAVFPNPYRTGRDAHITFIGLPLFARLQITDPSGGLVWTGREEEQGHLSREIRWRGTNNAGFAVASGLYIYTVRSLDGEVLKRDRIALIR